MRYAIIIIVFILIFVAIQTTATKRRINISIALAEKAVPFSREIEGAETRILVIGDSTAVGVGAERPELSIAGRVGETYPDAGIVNKGISGEKTFELAERLSVLEDHYDLIMLHIGGNDIVRFTNLSELETSITRALELAKNKADNVVLTSSGNFKTVKLLPLGSRFLFEHRTKRVREIFIQVAKEQDVSYVDLFREKEEDPFAKDPEKYYSEDFFHPSDEGYEDWYTIIAKTLEGIKF